MFPWDTRKAIVNFEKHGVSFEETATVFVDPEGLNWEDLALIRHSFALGNRAGTRLVRPQQN